MHWRTKLCVKMVSGKLPILKRGLKSLGYFKHGDMQSREYATGVLNKHLVATGIAAAAKADGGDEVDVLPSKSGKGVCMEIGPGESLMTMILAKAAGFSKTIFIDYGNQLYGNIQGYVDAADFLRSRGFDVPAISVRDGLDGMMEKYNAEYRIHGIDSLKSVENESIDFSFSEAVFEHLPKSQVAGYLSQLRRTGSKGGLSSHVVDLKDHLGGSINHLRFSESRWETPVIYQSGIYTNRLRYPHWLEMFRKEGFDFEIVRKSEFKSLPLEKGRMDAQFAKLEDGDLRVNGFHVKIRWT